MRLDEGHVVSRCRNGNPSIVRCKARILYWLYQAYQHTLYQVEMRFVGFLSLLGCVSFETDRIEMFGAVHDPLCGTLPALVTCARIGAVLY